jgi:hypothetical protein
MLTAIVILLITGSNSTKREFNEKITLNRENKIPYGTYAAYNNLKHIFPSASININKSEPGYWDFLSNDDPKQAIIIVCKRFNPDDLEMKKMISFAENGNDVFIAAMDISETAQKMLGCKCPAYFSYGPVEEISEEMQISLASPPFDKETTYLYPGRKFNTYFSVIDTSTTNVLGNDENGNANFIRLHAGKGDFFVHTEPLAFSNYFILYKNNIEYYEKALSIIRPDATRVVWDEYFLEKQPFEYEPQQTNSWLTVLFRYPALKAALLTAIFTLLLYVLMEMRRKQRSIPVISKPRNDSLEFVKTIGRLYYDKGDHKNLCKKMGAYFLEHVRSKYKLSTSTMDEQFVKNLLYKSGAEESEIRGIVSFIKYLDDAVIINDDQLTDFHRDLESFYKKA